MNRFADHLPIGVYETDVDGRFTYVNARWSDLTGIHPESAEGVYWADVVHPEDVERVVAEWRRSREDGRDFSLEYRYVDPDGKASWIWCRAVELRGADGQISGYLGACADTSVSPTVDRALEEAERRFANAFEEAPIGMALVGLDGSFMRVNRALPELVGYEADELLGLTFQDITHPEDLDADLELLRQVIAGERRSYRMEKRYIRPDGQQVWVNLSVSLVRSDAGEPLYFVSQIEDVTERKHFEGQLQYLADHDSLTGLFNRRRFEEELSRELVSAQRYAGRLAVLAIDLDEFKYINDSLGHSIGDELIVQVGQALRARLRRSDVLARLGGDEFAVILPRIEEPEALAVAADLLEAVGSVDLVGLGARGGGKVSASIGVAMLEPDSKLTAEELLVEADIAMYDAKEAGRARVVVYDATEDREERMLSRMTWADRIREALADEAFVLYSQPVMSLRDDPVARCELLLRMEGEGGDVVPPGSFLYIAERFDLVQQIDRWVVSRAIEILAEQQAAGREVVLCVNLSAKSVTDPQLPDHIAGELEAHGADGRGLCFEVTETAAVVNVDRARQFARRVGELGCEFALDDFGAGFASFYYLKHLAFDLLKIDGEFVTDLAGSVTNQLVVKAVVDIARGLGKRTVAEFVEDAETLELLRGMGVDYAQGYHIAKPAPLPLVEAPLPHLERA